MQSTQSSSHFESKSETKTGLNYPYQNHLTKLSNLYITDSEKTSLFQQRQKSNFANPKRLFLFKHIYVGFLSHLTHVLVLLMSLPILFFLGISSLDQTIEKVGSFSNKTTFFSVYQVLFTALVVWHLKKLNLNTKANPIKRYWTAMASNSALCAVINLLKFEILVLLCVSLITFAADTSMLASYEKILYGSISDEYEVFRCIIYLLIVTFSFRFCNKELTQ